MVVLIVSFRSKECYNISQSEVMIMIKKQYAPINWSEVCMETQTLIGSLNYTNVEVPTVKDITLNSCGESIGIDRIIKHTDL